MAFGERSRVGYLDRSKRADKVVGFLECDVRCCVWDHNEVVTE